MRSCATPGGGVMFIPEDIEHKKCVPVSYNDLISEDDREVQGITAMPSSAKKHTQAQKAA